LRGAESYILQNAVLFDLLLRLTAARVILPRHIESLEKIGASSNTAFVGSNPHRNPIGSAVSVGHRLVTY